MKKESTIKQHYLWGDITKGIAIILVIAGHSYFPKNISNFIYLFHMPIFFLLAGYFFNFSKYCNNLTLLVKSSAKRLLLPAFIWKFFFFNVTNRNFLNNLLIILYGSGCNVLNFKISIGAAWFLPCLFLVRILLWIFLKLVKIFKTNDIINCIIAFFITLTGIYIGKYIKLPWSLDISLVALYIAYIGYLLNKYAYYKKKFLSAIIIIITSICTYFDYKYFGLDLNDRIYTNPIISINTAIGLSILVIEISMLLEKVQITYLNLFLKYLGVNSIIILLSHHIAYSDKLNLVMTLLKNMLNIMPTNPYLYGIFITIWRLIVCILIIEIFTLIPAIKKIFSAVSIISIIQEYRNNK